MYLRLEGLLSMTLIFSSLRRITIRLKLGFSPDQSKMSVSLSVGRHIIVKFIDDFKPKYARGLKYEQCNFRTSHSETELFHFPV